MRRSAAPLDSATVVEMPARQDSAQAYLAPARTASGARVAPRLFDLHQVADYLGVSYWSVRDWVLAGLLPIVELPALRPREGERPRKTLRRVLVDREDLDAFIASRKRISDGPMIST